MFLYSIILLCIKSALLRFIQMDIMRIILHATIIFNCKLLWLLNYQLKIDYWFIKIYFMVIWYFIKTILKCVTYAEYKTSDWLENFLQTMAILFYVSIIFVIIKCYTRFNISTIV